MGRYCAKQVADSLNLAGPAKDETAGNLTIEVQGEEEKLAEFTRWCQKGPKLAKVEKIREE